MTEKASISEYLQKNAHYNPEDFGRFKEDGQDQLVNQLNVANAEVRNYQRSEQILSHVFELIDSITRIYSSQYQPDLRQYDGNIKSQKEHCRWDLVSNVENLLLYEIVFESGTASQELQLLRAIGLLTDQYFSIDDYDASGLVKKTLSDIFKDLKKKKINPVDLDLTGTEDNNLAFSKLIRLLSILHHAVYIINEKKHLDGYKLTKQETSILFLSSQLHDQIASLLYYYADQVALAPTRLKAFHLKADIEKRLRVVQGQLKEARKKMSRLSKQADENNIQFDTSLDLYTKEP